ncbi:hypothetical protein AO726_07090 [Pseudomonas sp. TTU2014-080ASC]|nr:hypothetical protein [Pseudomonas sp. TTU2014-080ASC]KRW61095.1 hypothetical protein AO726_07090 [Pseudomonas sp. TTU2014-080ASC]
MIFKDLLVCREQRYSIGVEEVTGKYYLSIPVSNRMIDYEEYYEIDNHEFNTFIDNPLLALPLVEKCRKREVDSRLLIKPGSDRGVAG